MKKINISTNKFPDTFTLVSASDYEELNRHKWNPLERKDGRLYVMRNIRVDGKRKTLYMHIAIIGIVDGKEIDHRNGNGLDNQRHNLRHCTHAENLTNRGVTRDNTSGFKGVSWNKGDRLWRSQMSINGKKTYLGSFFCIIKAAKAYDEAAIKYHGEFANLNFRTEGLNYERRTGISR